jgi:hypothetical protein
VQNIRRRTRAHYKISKKLKITFQSDKLDTKNKIGKTEKYLKDNHGLAGEKGQECGTKCGE